MQSKLALKKIYYPSTLYTNFTPFANGYIIWYLNHFSSLKIYFPRNLFDTWKLGRTSLGLFSNDTYTKFYQIHTLFTQRKKRAYSSLVHIFLRQLLVGVSSGFKKNLSVRGVGYKFRKERNLLFVDLGFSYPLFWFLPKDFKIRISRKMKGMSVKSFSLIRLSSYLSTIKRFKPVNVYTQKGVKFRREFIRVKERRKKKNF